MLFVLLPVVLQDNTGCPLDWTSFPLPSTPVWQMEEGGRKAGELFFFRSDASPSDRSTAAGWFSSITCGVPVPQLEEQSAKNTNDHGFDSQGAHKGY